MVRLAKMHETIEHPWEKFLNARIDVILWMKNIMKYDDKQIAEMISIDEIQLSSFLRHIEHLRKNDNTNSI